MDYVVHNICDGNGYYDLVSRYGQHYHAGELLSFNESLFRNGNNYAMVFKWQYNLIFSYEY